MNRKFLFAFPFFLFSFPFLINAQEVLRGEVKIEQEPIYRSYIEEPYPLDSETAYHRALELAAMFFSGQIYGWSFYYDVGERARGIEEKLELTPLGEIPWGDPGLLVTHTRLENRIHSVWMDYRPTDAQRRRLEMWKMGNIRAAQAIGYSPTGDAPENLNWLAIRKNALEDAARAAIRAMLQASERNRPKEVTGFISLESFPSFWIDGGRWAARARFKVEIKEIIPFASY